MSVRSNGVGRDETAPNALRPAPPQDGVERPVRLAVDVPDTEWVLVWPRERETTKIRALSDVARALGTRAMRTTA